ncbi:hypothetical protein PHMEG_00015771 [Phytophthora megakarya]|uniref:Reverse transcriptase RNase H-like domain-containing protein n=1 Tax=Phytophthora megakarya TaxID=4795 RepID=A0A225W1Z2_9STRA|nr:hypothetical protein PHMEG_00015771 [Phytophthora megakarya]
MPGTHCTVDSNGDIEMTVPHPVKEFTRVGENDATVISTVKGSGKPEVLQTMTRFLLKGKPVVFVTDDEILQLVHQRCQSLIEFERRDCRTDGVAEEFPYLIDRSQVFCALQVVRCSYPDATAFSLVAIHAAILAVVLGFVVLAVYLLARGRPQPVTTRVPKTATPPTEGCLFCKGTHWLLECADYTILPSSVLRALDMATPPHVYMHRMSRPVTVTLADGTIKTCTEEITLCLQLTTAKRHASSLGIDVKDMLVQLALLATEEDEFPVAKSMVGTAVRNVYPADRRGELEEIVTSTREMWCTQVSAGPPARNYPVLQVEFIHGYIRQLLERSLIRKNNALKWASAVVPVRKPGIDNQFQLTIDYRPVNAQTVPVASRATESALHFQAQMQTVLALMIPRNVMCSIEGIFIFTKDMHSSLAALQKFLDITGGMGSNSTLHRGSDHAPSTEHSGGAGVFVCAANRLHESMPDFAPVVAALQDKLLAEGSKLGRRQLMTFPDDGCEACLFVDGSQEGYAIILTQVSEWSDELMMKEQDHHLIVWKVGCSGIFNCDKEALPIVKACQDLSYVLQRVDGFRLSCHHANLFYVFVPKLELKEHVRDRLQRWVMHLWGMRYTI